MDFLEGREPLGVVAPEVLEDAPLGVDPEELAADLEGQDLGVGELGSLGAALAQGRLPFEPVVDLTENGRYEGAKIHEREPPFRSGEFGRHQA